MSSRLRLPHQQLEEELRKSEEKFSNAFRESPIALILTSAKDGRFIEVNDTFEHMTGWRRDEVIGRTPYEIDVWVRAQPKIGHRPAARVGRNDSKC